MRAALLLALLLLVACSDTAPEPTFDGLSVARWARDLKGDVTADTTLAIERLGAGGMEAVGVLAALTRQARASGDLLLTQGTARAVAMLVSPEVIRGLVAAGPEDEDAALVLRMIGGAIDDLREALVRSMKDPDPEIRLRAVLSLENMAEDNVEARRAIEKALTDEDPRVRTAAANALEAVPER